MENIKNMKRFIYYGAGKYIRVHFEHLSQKYPPLCFCDQTASSGSGEDTLFDLPILAPSALLDQYPDAPILISLSPAVAYEAQQWLVHELGIDKERIVNCYKKIRGCYLIRDELNLSLQSCTKCCGIPYRNASPRILFSTEDSTPKKIGKILQMQNRLETALAAGIPCECDGCREIGEISVPDHLSGALKRLIISLPYIGCNLKCSYCEQTATPSGRFDALGWKAMIEEMKSRGILDESTLMLFASGELTIHPQCREIFSVFQEFPCLVFSNCTAYNKAFASHIALGKTSIVTSLDAGTQETFAKVKGADCFEKVCQNLMRYMQEGAKIQLKYILLRDINDNEADVNGFIRLAKELGAECVLIRRNYFDPLPCSDNMLLAIEKLCTDLKDSHITVSLDQRILADETAVSTLFSHTNVDKRHN